MKVKIVSCVNPRRWYANEIGNEFEVLESVFDLENYKFENKLIFILKKDCEIVEEWQDGDTISNGIKYMLVDGVYKDRVAFISPRGNYRLSNATISELKALGFKKVQSKLQVTQAMLVECFLKTNNLTMDKIELT